MIIDTTFNISNAGNPHARHSDAVQIAWADGHVSALKMPFTQQEQDADANGLSRTTSEGLYGPNAFGDGVGGAGGTRGGGGGRGNYFDLKASTPDDEN